uniref:Glycosyl hydrolase n=1 Tax=viral metagenome TaxID=1070528 RepID=A0A6M3KMM9_9ZZZZ
MSAVDVPATGGVSGSIITELKNFPNNAPHDISIGGERWLKTGLMETNPAKFDAYLWRWSVGTYWQPINVLGSVRVLDIASNGAGIVIAILPGGMYSRSADGGKTFSGSTPLPNGGNEVMAIEWVSAFGLFIVVGRSGVILTSTDGQAFQSRSSGTSASLQTICWTGAVLVIGGDSKTIVTSINGINYTPKVVNITANYNAFYQIVHFDGKILALAESHTNGSAISADNGATWSMVTVDASVSTAIHGGVHDGEKFVAVFSGSRVATSVNGTDWTVTAMTVSSVYSGSKLIFDAGQYWASSASGGRIAKSEDLAIWRDFDIDFYTASPGTGSRVKKTGGQYWAMGTSAGLYRGNVEPYAGWPVAISAYGAEVTFNGQSAYARVS